MSKIAFIYPGQGAQKAGMGADFYENSRDARELYDGVSEILGLDMRKLCFTENEKLDLTEYTQAALVTTCLAMTRVVRERGLRPDITAGLSLGEYAAIAAAGGMDEIDAARLVRKRGILMQDTVPAGVGGMCAVIGMDVRKIEDEIREIASVTVANYNCPGQIVITGNREAVEMAADRLKAAGGMDEIDAARLVRKRGILMQDTVPAGVGGMCAVIGMDVRKIEDEIREIDGVTVANYNCPGQIVITGNREAVEMAVDRLKGAGARKTVMLNVSGPFHSPLLLPAGAELARALESVELHPLTVPYVTNVTSEIIEDIAMTKSLLAEQVSSPVQWMQSVEKMIAYGVDIFVEIGPGTTLAGFIKKIDRSVKVYHIGVWEDVEKVAGELC